MIRRSVLGLALALAADPIAAEDAPRVISLGGSVTEIVVALGAGDRLVARDTTSTYPASVEALPDVGYVRALSAEGVLALSPDLILAEDGAGPPEAVDVLQAAGIGYVKIPAATTPEGVIGKITAVAAALEMPEAGAKLAAQVSADMDRVAAAVAGVTQPKRVLFVLSLQGGRVMAGGEGSTAEGIIELAGGVNAASGFQGYKPMTDEAILTAAPDVILMMNRHGDDPGSNDDVMAQPALSQTPAARAGAVVRMDGLLLLGFGPRLPEAAMTLHDALYPAKG
ncbi:heme/hemin ABC transporter substrate-binding protein [Pseudogemmobacter blasticus]|uniref:Hemin ABC transporter substrate-binding protein n=1 Tax=Fuscovulum blasticum DSM 2131 TaxID=1188250 RepID=A0A2T4JD97_FUSBL|nr:ABC transporter substrate-binding protein [Fuscovulum blasticum]PTE15869.1 hemin ABC transporter substrate-binding protein [Fuscovulum blasticum DSM 2131]